jgi:hypothetical protein
MRRIPSAGVGKPAGGIFCVVYYAEKYSKHSIVVDKYSSIN